MAISYSTFLEMSVTASLMIVAILVFRQIFKRVPRWVFCLMWGIVAIRLVLPVSLESGFSLLPEKEMISSSAVIGMIYDKDVNAQDVLSGRFPSEDTNVPSPDSDGDILNDRQHQSTSDITAPDGDGVILPDSQTTDIDVSSDENNGSYTVKTVLFIVWVMGAVILAGYFAFSAISLKMKLSTATLLYKNIRQSENIKSPFVFGFFSPKIYLPYNIKPSDMPYVLAHETAHISRGDHITKVIAFSLLSLYWFNPLVWIAYVTFCRDVELACDEKVIKTLDTDGRRSYSYALLNCSVKRNSFAGCPVAFGETDVRRRVSGVMKYKKSGIAMIAFALAATVLASLCLMTYPIAQEPDNSGVVNTNDKTENNEQGNIDNINLAFEHTNRGLTVTTTEESPTDGRYTEFLLINGDVSVNFTGNALAEYSPYVYYKVMCGDYEEGAPVIIECGEPVTDGTKIAVNFVTEHTEDTHKEELHLFDPTTMKEYEVLDVGALISDEIVIRETQSYYVFEFFSTKVVISRDYVEANEIDLSGDLDFGSYYRYYPARVGSCTTDRDMVCEMIWREADGDAFARVRTKFYYTDGKYIISSAEIDLVSPNTRLSRCDDIDILNHESSYSQADIIWVS